MTLAQSEIGTPKADLSKQEGSKIAPLPDEPNRTPTHQDIRSSPLLQAVEVIARHHNLPFSQASALTGLPLGESGLGITHLEAAFANVGLAARVVKKRASEVPLIVCPFLVVFKGGDIGIVHGKRGMTGKYLLEMAGHAGRRAVTAKALDAETMPYAVYASPAVDTFSEGEEGRELARGHWLWSTVRRFWGAWSQVVLVALFVNLLALALPIFVMNVYDRVIPYNAIPTLWALAAGVALALGFDFLLRMLRATIIDNAGRRIDMRVSSDIYNHVLDARMDQRPHSAGDIASSVREFENVRDFFTSASLTSAIDLVFVGLFLAVLWIIVGPLVLVPLIAVPVVLLATILIQIPLAKSVKKGLVSNHHRHSVLVESLVGVETVKTTSSEGAFQRRWDAAVADTVRATSSSRFWSSLSMFFSMFVQQSVSVVIIVWGVYLVAAGDISVGALIASNILAGRVLAPLGGIAMTLTRSQQSFSALAGLNKLMALPRDHDLSTRRAGEITSARLEFRDVGFTYPGTDHSVLKAMNLTITPGERVGIVGRVGSGKSTVGKLLCGLYETTDGGILLDDVDVKHCNRADLRRAVGFVSQSPDLFSGTLRENICFNGAVSAEKFEEACFVSGVAVFAQSHPLGYEMPVGERGAFLSGGQKQAVALARALILQPRILFLDEPSAAMDTTTEAALVRNLKAHKSKLHTFIVATHRTSLLDLVDRIIVLDKGAVVHDGPRDQVLRAMNPKANKARLAKGGARVRAKVNPDGA
ncbi:MAG: type I secretion system permease/ATPase [Pseudomonadota bacterium]